MNNNEDALIIRSMGEQPYKCIWQRMREFTDTRMPDTHDELWLLQHPPVFTLGQASKPEHLLRPKDIPVVQTDRGGQVTYHGPGQLVVYFLIDLRRKSWGIRCLVSKIEQSVITFLAQYGIEGRIKEGAPGVYIAERKIASIGLRVRRGCTYHGLSFNIDMDLEPFSRINPCGYQGLQLTQLRDFVPSITMDEIQRVLVGILSTSLNNDLTLAKSETL